MKRSEINAEIKKAEAFFGKCRFSLPPWAYWKPGDWTTVDSAAMGEIRKNRLGWDVTDMGSGDFQRRGLVLFTIRNGGPGNPAKSYAEKLMLVQENQETALHYHSVKTEDIINRGGGILVLELFHREADSSLGRQPVTASIDGIQQTVAAGERIRLETGESICLKPYVYHRFYAENGGGPVMAGEVSTVNDDETDNYFYEELPRYPEIEEDEEPFRLLCTEY